MVHKREGFSSCEGEGDYFSEKDYSRESSQASWMARECDKNGEIKEKDSAILGSSDEQLSLMGIRYIDYNLFFSLKSYIYFCLLNC